MISFEKTIPFAIMVRDLQYCASCGDRVGENRVWRACGGCWETERSEEFFCGCGEHFCSIDCLIVHGDEEHTNGDITTWPVGTDSRLFESGEIERRWQRENAREQDEQEELSSDESNMDSSDSESECESEIPLITDDDNNVYCECGNVVGYLVDGQFRTDPDCYRSECDQDGYRWCSDCWGLDREYQEECDRDDSNEQENETEPVQHCYRCNCNARGGFTNNKGVFCSNECLREWSGCPHICPEMVAETPVARRLNFEQVAENAAVDFEELIAPLLA